MSGQLVVRLGDAQHTWIGTVVDVSTGAAVIEAQPMELPQLQTLAEQFRAPIILLVPVTKTTFHQLKLPAMSARKRASALPFALEDQLAEDIEHLHFSELYHDDRGITHVAVMNALELSTWVTQFTDLGISVGTVLPDVLALPYDQDAWSILLDETQVLLRSGQCQGCFIDPDNIKLYLGQLLAAEDTLPNKLHVYKAGEVPAEWVKACRSLEMQYDIAVHVVTVETPVTSFLSQHALAFQKLSVLQSMRAQAITQWFSQFRFTKTMAALLVASLLLVPINQVFRYLTASKEHQQLQSYVETVYKRVFPNATHVVSPRIQIAAHLRHKEVGSDDHFLKLLTPVAAAMRTVNGVSLTALQFEGRGLQLHVRADASSVLDRFSQVLAKQQVRIVSQQRGAGGASLVAEYSVVLPA